MRFFEAAAELTSRLFPWTRMRIGVGVLGWKVMFCSVESELSTEQKLPSEMIAELMLLLEEIGHTSWRETGFRFRLRSFDEPSTTSVSGRDAATGDECPVAVAFSSETGLSLLEVLPEVSEVSIIPKVCVLIALVDEVNKYKINGIM